MMIHERCIAEDLEGSGRGLISILFQHLPVETDEDHETSVRIFAGPAAVRTEYLTNAHLRELPQHISALLIYPVVRRFGRTYSSSKNKPSKPPARSI
jgi:hypothetical protein